MIHKEKEKISFKKKLKKSAKERKFEKIWKKKNTKKPDSNPQPTKRKHFGNIGPNRAGKPVLVSDGLPKATVHLY